MRPSPLPSLLILLLPTLLTPTLAQRPTPTATPPHCTLSIYTQTVSMVLGQYTIRRRVVYETDKRILADEYDRIMYGFGLRWGEYGRECRARVEDMRVYYHGTVVPGGVYVVDSSEEQSTRGRKAHECLLEYFTAMLVEELGCSVDEQAGRDYV
ncbi:hypothetical protein J1614_012033 [Plenodomus biglobosus]|nr:hypothetical protein J1614_012033 [Plenodomus biglobosus]